MPLNPSGPLWALAQLLKDRQIYAGSVQGATTRAADGMLLNFPSTMRAPARPIRGELAEGLIEPSMSAALGYPSSKTDDAFRLARRTVNQAFPNTKLEAAVATPFDLVARPSDSTAIAALQAPRATGDEATAFLNDLVASPAKKGAGYNLLKGVLSNPDILPSSRQVLFTPLEGARGFYKDRFGAYMMSPDEALSDPYIKAMIEKLGETTNAKDLGVGIIQRAGGGWLPPMSSGRSPASEDRSLVTGPGTSRNPSGEDMVNLAASLAAAPALGPLGRLARALLVPSGPVDMAIMGGTYSDDAEALPNIVPAAMRAGLWPQVRYRAAVPGKFETTHPTPEAANAYLRKHATTPSGWDDGAHIAPVFVSRDRDALFPEHDYFPTLRALSATR